MRNFKANSPLPQSLEEECKKCALILSNFSKPEDVKIQEITKQIPKQILKNAKGIAVMTVVKAGFIWSGRAGSGLVVAKLDNGEWSAPSAIGTAGMGLGLQIGAELTDFVIILNTKEAVDAFFNPNVTLGGNLAIAAGPYGRNAEVGGTLTKQLAPIFSYSSSQGLFAGASIEGSVIVERKDANAKFYHESVSCKEILTGFVTKPAGADPLYKAIKAITS